MPASMKLCVGAAIVIAVTAYMAYVGASTSWQYYLTADECLANSPQFVGHRLRVSGRVAEHTLSVDAGRTEAKFALEGRQGRLDVACSGVLPDNLAEGVEVVVEGRIDKNGLLRGDKLLTRCASKYESGAPRTAAKTNPVRAIEEAL